MQTTPQPIPAGKAAGSQTLDRGLRVLQTVLAAPEGLSVTELAEAVGLHRSVTYRLVRTLEAHQLITRDRDGRYQPGGGLALLTRAVTPTLKVAARPHLEHLAEQASMTAFLVVPADGQALTVLVVEPKSTLAHVSYRPGSQHSLDKGAPGLAILSAGPVRGGERAEVGMARQRGWALSHSEVILGYRSCSAPVRDPSGRCVGAVAVVYAHEPGGLALKHLVRQVVACAESVGADLG